MLSERDPRHLPWGDLGVDVVIESTGFFTDRDEGRGPPRGGRPVRDRLGTLRRAPTPPSCSASTTSDFDRQAHKVVSNASCTTNCFVPMVKVLDDAFGVEQGLMTDGARLHGRPEPGRWSAQATCAGPARAAVNIVPTSTGAARATSSCCESMKGRLDGTVAAGAGARRLDHRLRRPSSSSRRHGRRDQRGLQEGGRRSGR